ncbi:MAG TPA: hypothetical protein VJM81_01500 [Rhizorhapis sp.]|nr:hypothetical protein [Rhizorhapis sp.]
MPSTFEIGKSLSAALCALLFGTTMILSAVGPARANSNAPEAILAQGQNLPAPGHYLA